MRRIMIGLLCLSALVGCAAPGTVRDGPSSSEPSVEPSVEPSLAWTTFQADVTAVRFGADPRSLVLTVALLAGGEGCSRDPRVTYLTEENNRVYANVVQDSRRAQEVGACPTHSPGTVTLTATAPIDDRIVVLNQQAWKRAGDAYERCDATFGCDPMPADHCDPAWIHVTVSGMDVSRHSVGTVEGCDGSWLVMTVPFDPVPCGAEPRPGCVVTTNIRRYFLRWVDPRGWQVIASTTEAGCGTVATEEPRFPTKLCSALPKP